MKDQIITAIVLCFVVTNLNMLLCFIIQSLDINKLKTEQKKGEVKG